jgi:integrase
VRVTSAGAKAFILNYRAGGRERRYTIGSYPDWKVSAARDEAKRLKKLIDVGHDPMAERHEQRAAPTIDDLADRFEGEHLSKRRFSTARDYRSMLKLYIRPHLGRMKVHDVRHADVERLHAAVAKTAPIRANRVVALLSKMLNLSIKWEIRTDNPVYGLERTPEERRERYLSPDEIERLAAALDAYPERTAVNAIRLILLTGARRGEALAAKWSEISLQPGAEAWSKPSAHTKTKRNHKVPLSAAAVALLTEMKSSAERTAI